MKKVEFIEGIDYYLFNGSVVMTEHYLKKRGYCCGNGCLNCPYDPNHTKGNTKLKNEEKEEKKLDN